MCAANQSTHLVLGLEHVEHRDDCDHLALEREHDCFGIEALRHERRLALDELLRGLLAGLDQLVEIVVEVVLERVREVFLRARSSGQVATQGDRAGDVSTLACAASCRKCSEVLLIPLSINWAA